MSWLGVVEARRGAEAWAVVQAAPLLHRRHRSSAGLPGKHCVKGARSLRLAAARAQRVTNRAPSENVEVSEAPRVHGKTFEEERSGA